MPITILILISIYLLILLYICNICAPIFFKFHVLSSSYPSSSVSSGLYSNDAVVRPEQRIGATIVKDYYFTDTQIGISFQQSSPPVGEKVPYSILKIRRVPLHTAESDERDHKLTETSQTQKLDNNSSKLSPKSMEYFKNGSGLETIPESGKGELGDSDVCGSSSSGLSGTDGDVDKKCTLDVAVTSSSESSIIQSGVHSLPPLATVYPYTSRSYDTSNEDISNEDIRLPITINVHADGTKSLPRMRYYQQQESQTSPPRFATMNGNIGVKKHFTTFGKNLSASSESNSSSSNSIESSPVRSSRLRKGIRFIRVSPLINPMTKFTECQDGGGHHGDDKPPSGPKTVTFDPVLKKRTWPGRGKVVTFMDCLGSQDEKDVSLHESTPGLTEDNNYVKISSEQPYEETETIL